MRPVQAVAVLTLLSVTAANGQARPTITGGSPDACQILSPVEITAVFPGAGVTKVSETLSPLLRGPQYVENCLYRLDPEPSTEGPRALVSFAIIRWQGATLASNTPEEGMSDLMAELGRTHRTTPIVVDGIGDEAFSLVAGEEARIYVRKADLIFQLSVDSKLDEASNVAAQLAELAANRWTGGSAKSKTEAKNVVGESLSSALPKWPNACELLPEAEVKDAFPASRLVETRPMSGSVRLPSGELVPLAEPVGCWYTLRLVEAGTTVTSQIQLTIENVLETGDAASDYFRLSTSVSGAMQTLEGAWTAAAMDSSKKITVQQGEVIFHLRVTGSDIDVSRSEQAAEVAKKLANSIALKLQE